MLSIVFLIRANTFFSTGNCGQFPTSDSRKSGNPEFRGAYTNLRFGYRVTLPRGIIAYGETPPMPAHGVGINLSWEPRSYLYIDGSYNAALHKDLAAAANWYARSIREESLAVHHASRNFSRLAGRKALRIKVEHRCESGTFVTDEIVLLNRNIIYRISLTAPQARYMKDRRVLNAIIRSFRLTRIRD